MGRGILVGVLSFVLRCFGGHNHKDHHHDKEGREKLFQDQGLLVALEATSRDPKPLVVLSHPTNITPKLVDPSPPLVESKDVVLLHQGRGDSGRRQVNARRIGDEVKVWRMVNDEVWKKHYCSRHKILLVGEGDFSFSSSLALAFGSAVNIVATSLDSQEFLYRNYKRAMANIAGLWTRGCLVINELDATQMAGHASLKGMKFDRIVFNFPHAGFFATETSVSQIRRHKKLIRMFMENAKKLMKEEGGEVHITHKTNWFHSQWDLEGLASGAGLRMIGKPVKFSFIEYPGYNTKYGFGGDKNFNCNPSSTFIFGASSQKYRQNI